MKKLISLSLALMLVFGALSLTSCGNPDDGTFVYNKWNATNGNDYYEIYAILDDETWTELTIPSEYKGLPVKKVREGAFSECVNLEKVTISSYVSIPAATFSSCTKLKEVVINCDSLSADGLLIGAGSSDVGITVTVGKALTELPNGIFRDSTNLKSIIFEQDGVLEKVGQYAFQNCPLKSVTLPETVKELDISAFEGAKMTEIELPSVDLTVAGSAFKNCASLTSLTIGAPKSITASSFTGCVMLNNVTCLSTKKTWTNAMGNPKGSSFSDVGTKSGSMKYQKYGIFLTIECTDGDIEYSIND